MKRVNVIENEFQQFRVACLETIDEDIEICYNNNILKHNFNYSDKVTHTYKYSLKHDGAMTKIEAEIFDIYQMMVKGGVLTRNGEQELFVIENNLDIKYAEGDSMIGLENVKIKSVGRHVFTSMYKIECGVCGHNGFTSVKKEMLPKCPKCAGKAHVAPQVPMTNALVSCKVEQIDEKTLSITDTDVNIELTLDNAQKETMAKITADSASDKLKALYAMTNKTIDSNKKETPRATPAPTTVSKPKATTTRKSKSKITDDDLTFVLQQIRANFTGKSFKSRDLAPKVVEKLTARQLPSRLTQLVNKGILDADNASPKNYTLKGE